jgi:hypothetical protein
MKNEHEPVKEEVRRDCGEGSTVAAAESRGQQCQRLLTGQYAQD